MNLVSSPKIIFLVGSVGVGKTWLSNKIIATANSLGISAVSYPEMLPEQEKDLARKHSGQLSAYDYQIAVINSFAKRDQALSRETGYELVVVDRHFSEEAFFRKSLLKIGLISPEQNKRLDEITVENRNGVVLPEFSTVRVVCSPDEQVRRIRKRGRAGELEFYLKPAGNVTVLEDLNLEYSALTDVPEFVNEKVLEPEVYEEFVRIFIP